MKGQDMLLKRPSALGRLFGRVPRTKGKPPVNGAKECRRRRKQLGLDGFVP